MKKVLVTGSSSYIGSNFKKWMEGKEKYQIDTVSVRQANLNDINLSKYDVVLHLAGIAHISTNPKLEQEYYKINRDLTIEIAEKAKKEGVSQFIFMSSIIVYGENSGSGSITKNTIPNPKNFYGKSKLQAEEGIKKLETDLFKIAIIRAPMIYGRNSKGNYQKLSKLAKKTYFFPNINNKRSMLYIDNLNELIRLIIVGSDHGIFYPQNSEYVKTGDMVKKIRKAHGKKTVLINYFNPLIKLMLKLNINIIKKVFGDLVYEESMSEYKSNYRVEKLEGSVFMTELGEKDGFK